MVSNPHNMVSHQEPHSTVSQPSPPEYGQPTQHLTIRSVILAPQYDQPSWHVTVLSTIPVPRSAVRHQAPHSTIRETQYLTIRSVIVAVQAANVVPRAVSPQITVVTNRRTDGQMSGR
jgi:hypothetical protein